MNGNRKRPFWNNTRVAIFSAILGSGTTILVALIGKLGYNRPSPCPPVTNVSQKQDQGTQNQVTQNDNKGDIKNEFISGDKVENYNGVKQRFISPFKLKFIIKQLPSFDVGITIVTVSNNAEADNYANSIMSALRKKGYSDIHIQYNQTMANIYDSISVAVMDDKKYAAIMVYPVKNVSR